ncbi:CPXCG motif-containing cysteine-rich protein [Nitrincola alkalilacustris]|uniref:CPXCG motif-containing cysteine-rich protein n=1 Tax=Nitrincola alkalilacustris TaxID=1571224 RepID=UPI00124DF6A2|nr:CPXCG motif-containing cysteine-rich protein [Nitrincola alkalilacustris]
MNPIESVEILCPYCSAPLSLMVDCSEADQEYVEDCQVCCSPILVHAQVTDGVQVSVSRENG